jgi:hypothetical protein
MYMGKYKFTQNDVYEYMKKNEIPICITSDHFKEFVENQSLIASYIYHKLVVHNGHTYELKNGKKGYGFYLVRGNIKRRKKYSQSASNTWREITYQITNRLYSKR